MCSKFSVLQEAEKCEFTVFIPLSSTQRRGRVELVSEDRWTVTWRPQEGCNWKSAGDTMHGLILGQINENAAITDKRAQLCPSHGPSVSLSLTLSLPLSLPKQPQPALQLPACAAEAIPPWRTSRTTITMSPAISSFGLEMGVACYEFPCVLHHA